MDSQMITRRPRPLHRLVEPGETLDGLADAMATMIYMRACKDPKEADRLLTVQVEAIKARMAFMHWCAAVYGG